MPEAPEKHRIAFLTLFPRCVFFTFKTQSTIAITVCFAILVVFLIAHPQITKWLCSVSAQRYHRLWKRSAQQVLVHLHSGVDPEKIKIMGPYWIRARLPRSGKIIAHPARIQIGSVHGIKNGTLNCIKIFLFKQHKKLHWSQTIMLFPVCVSLGFAQGPIDMWLLCWGYAGTSSVLIRRLACESQAAPPFCCLAQR